MLTSLTSLVLLFTSLTRRCSRSCTRKDRRELRIVVVFVDVIVVIIPSIKYNSCIHRTHWPSFSGILFAPFGNVSKNDDREVHWKHMIWRATLMNSKTPSYFAPDESHHICVSTSIALCPLISLLEKTRRLMLHSNIPRASHWVISRNEGKWRQLLPY